MSAKNLPFFDESIEAVNIGSFQNWKQEMVECKRIWQIVLIEV
jgi:hypothetical protein